MYHIRKWLFCLFALLMASSTKLLAVENKHAVYDPTSFGQYSRYELPEYNGYERESVYVKAGDGTPLALDIYRPTRNGVVETQPLPVVWTFTPYNRAVRNEDGVISANKNVQMELLAYGYIIAVADVRGKGASFGTRNGPADINETRDAETLTHWLATQSWSNGNVGMAGCSYFGATALQAISTGSPYLKAVFVGTTMFDQYGTFAKGGIASEGLYDDVVPVNTVVEVDADKDRSLLKNAWEGQKLNTPTGQFFASTPFRDDINPFTHTRWWQEASFYPHLSNIRDDTGIYVYGGYHDLYADQTIYKYLSLTTPKKLAFGEWPHCESPGFHLDVERLRFFDYWLKGIENGVMDESPVHVYVGNAKDGTEWRALSDWPQASRTRYYLNGHTTQFLNAGMRGEPSPFKSGGLTLLPPGNAQALALSNLPDSSPYIVYGTVRGDVARHSVSYTLPPTSNWREIIGSPVAHIWISSSRNDADIFVYLEHIDSMGGAQVIARGQLRASHRKITQPPYETDGTPWHSHARTDYAPLIPNEPVELDIPLTPVSYTYRPGDLLRLSVTTIGRGRDPSSLPEVKVISTEETPSWLELPLTDTRQQAIAPDKTLGIPAFYETQTYITQ